MPGSVANAAPSTVMPKFLCAQFTRARAYELNENEYRNGESQRALKVSSSRKSWQLSARHAPAALATLRTFISDRRGPLEPFYFYDLTEGAHDPTGASLTGRYTVRINGAWSEETAIGRTSVPLELVEIN